MKIVTWNMNNRAANQKAWDIVLDLEPDLALLAEVNYLPAVVRDYNLCCEPAMGHARKPRRFKTCILTTGDIFGSIELTAKQTWVTEGLRVFSGNFVARRIRFDKWGTANVVSVHMPSWYFPYREFTDDDVSEVILPNYSLMSMSELLWAALRETMAKFNGDWIVGGDFNTSEFIGQTKRQNDANREAIARMERLGFVEAVRHLKGGPVPSWRASRRDAPLKHQLDHLYLSGEFRTGLVSAEIGAPGIDWTVSDHLPVIAEIEPPT
jgi:exonuclease III